MRNVRFPNDIGLGVEPRRGVSVSGPPRSLDRETAASSELGRLH